MDFMGAIQSEIKNRENKQTQLTENGAVGFAKSGSHPLVDMTFKVSSYRDKSISEIIDDFQIALIHDPEYTLKWLFYVRDIRGGLGERRLFRFAMTYLALYHTDQLKLLLPLIAEYGRFDDLLLLAFTPVYPTVIDIVKKQLADDKANMEKGKPVSLLAKWMPSENASSKLSKKLARRFYEGMEVSPRTYRKLLSALRKHLDVIECKMASNQWDQIKYEAVPTKANLIYRQAFLKHDEERRNKFLADLASGKTKINSAACFPHDIVHRVSHDDSVDPALEQMWKALPSYNLNNTLVVADGSGSMRCQVGNTAVTAWEIAHALAIYCAEHNAGSYYNKYITFSEHPKFVDFSNLNMLAEKIRAARLHSEVANTNIEAVFDLILKTAITNHISQENMVKNILIISDMEFDRCASSNSFGGGYDDGIDDKALFEVISDKYKQAGYILPRLVFWNVASDTCTFPTQRNELGLVLVSGFSPTVLKMVMNGKLDPWEALREVLDGDRYKAIVWEDSE